MSLHAAAQHLSSQGRGPDNTLVHMSRGEVKSLNDLAMAHGGSLSINPQTGLPEAGFLSKLLPMIAGAGLMMIPGVGPMMAAGLVGGGTTLMTGSLKKGLMAGLGAYGGAGLGASLMGAGAAEAASIAGALPDAAAAAVPDAAAAAIPEAALTAPIAPPVAGASPSISNALPANASFNPTQITSMPGANTGVASANPVTPSVTPSVTPPVTATAQPNLATTNMEGHMYGGKELPTFEEGFPVTAPKPTFSGNMANMQRGFTGENLMNYATAHPYQTAAMIAPALMPDDKAAPGYKGDADMGQRYSYSANPTDPLPTPASGGQEQKYFAPTYTKISDEEAKNIYGFAGGGPVETMSNLNAIGANTGYPMADISKGRYATPYQSPNPQNIIAGSQDVAVDPYTGQEQRTTPAPQAQFARGGLSSAASHLGDYSDGGRLLRGPGDGVSDSIPAMIGKKQPARLADGEFVVPARIVSELGNGSTEAGARKLYAMLDRVQAARKKSIGKGKVAKNSRADKLLPA